MVFFAFLHVDGVWWLLFLLIGFQDCRLLQSSSLCWLLPFVIVFERLSQSGLYFVPIKG